MVLGALWGCVLWWLCPFLYIRFPRSSSWDGEVDLTCFLTSVTLAGRFALGQDGMFKNKKHFYHYFLWQHNTV